MNRPNTWPARRRSQRQRAHSLGYRDEREMREVERELAVKRLRDFLDDPLAVKDLDEWFETSVVADAIGSSPKIVRSLAHSTLMSPWKSSRSKDKARKLYFRAATVRSYVRHSTGINYGAWLNPPYRGMFQSEKLAVNRKFAKGEFATKALAASVLGLSIRGVEYLIRTGKLAAKRLGARKVVVVLRDSLSRLYLQRVREAAHEWKSAKRGLELAQHKVQRVQEKWRKRFRGPVVAQGRPLKRALFAGAAQSSESPARALPYEHRDGDGRANRRLVAAKQRRSANTK